MVVLEVEEGVEETEVEAVAEQRGRNSSSRRREVME